LGVQLERGHAVDRYVVEGLIGQGGVASVYRVTHQGLGTVHALKVVHVPSPVATERLLREGRVQGRLHHPNVVSVTDLVTVRGALGLVMDLVPGPSLAAFLGCYRPMLDEVDTLARGILSGVAAAHRVGLVHRDLKPGNILLDVADGRIVPKIVDFGLAKVLEAEPDSPLATRAGSSLGTPAYMAPEQILDASTVDERADVFALGAILFELLAGERAFDCTSVSGVQDQIRQGRHGQLPASVPEAWREAVMGALATNPNLRIASVDALRQQWTGGTSVAPIQWCPEALDAARTPIGLPLQNTSPDSSTFADSVPTGHETWLEDEAGRGLTLPDTSPRSPVRVGHRGRRVGAGVMGLILVGATAWFLQPRPVTVLTSTGVPLLAEGNTQRQFDEAWQAMLAGDFAEAHRRLGPVREALPEAPLPHMLDGEVLMLDGDVAGGLEAMRDAYATMVDGHGGHGSPLVQMMREVQDRGAVTVGPELFAYIEARPDDYLARIMAAQYCSTTSKVDVCERAHALLLEADDTHMVAHMAIASSWMDLGELDRVREAAQRGLEIDPAEPGLLSLVGRTWLAEGDVAHARAALQLALEADPRRRGAKIGLAQAALIADDGSFERASQELLAPTVPAVQRVELHTEAAHTLHGLGRVAESLEHLEIAVAIEEAEGTPLGQLTAMSHMSLVLATRGRGAGTLALNARESLLIASSPEIPNPVRNRYAAYRPWAEGLVAGGVGDREGVARALARVERAEFSQTAVVESLRRELAILDADPMAIRDNAGFYWTSCDRHASLGESMRRAGLLGEAEGEWRKVLDAPCRLHRPERLNRVMALVGLAEVADAAGDEEQKRALLEQARALWPRPDADVRVAQRLLEME
jgi:serine/threonine-protein kinase